MVVEMMEVICRCLDDEVVEVREMAATYVPFRTRIPIYIVLIHTNTTKYAVGCLARITATKRCSSQGDPCFLTTSAMFS